jgi:hypothetical protein
MARETAVSIEGEDGTIASYVRVTAPFRLRMKPRAAMVPVARRVRVPGSGVVTSEIVRVKGSLSLSVRGNGPPGAKEGELSEPLKS